MCKKCCRAGQAADDNLAHALCMMVTLGYKYAHSGCAILIVFPHEQCLCERAAMLLYTYLACLVVSMLIVHVCVCCFLDILFLHIVVLSLMFVRKLNVTPVFKRPFHPN